MELYSKFYQGFHELSENAGGSNSDPRESMYIPKRDNPNSIKPLPRLFSNPSVLPNRAYFPRLRGDCGSDFARVTILVVKKTREVRCEVRSLPVGA